MSSGRGIEYKFTQTGIDDLIQKIKDLHNQLRSGKLPIDTYKSDMREITPITRSATSEFNQLKGAVYAANPGLLEFTRTMSIFGGVANTVLSVTNAINLATIVGNQYDQQVADTQVQLAEVKRKAASDLAAYKQDSQQYQDDLQLEAALTNKLAYEEQQRARQSIQNTVTIIASSFAVASSVSQTYLGLKTLWAGFSVDTQANIASIGSALLRVLGPIAIFIAAFYGAYALIRALNPKYAQSMDELAKTIQNNWHVDSLTSQLIAPFVGAYLGFAKIEDDITEQLYNFINSIINTLNTVPDTVNKAFGRTVIPRLQNLLPPGFADNGQNSFYNQAIRSLNIGGAPSPTVDTKPLVDAQNKTSEFVKSLLGTWNSSTNPTLLDIDLGASNLVAQGRELQKLAQAQVDGTDIQSGIESSLLTSGQQQGKALGDIIDSVKSSTNPTLKLINQKLNDIYTQAGIKSVTSQDYSNQLAKMQLDSINSQKANIDLQKATLIMNTDKIKELQKLPQTSLYAAHYDSDTGEPIYDTVESDAAKQIKQLQGENAVIAQKIGSAGDIIGGLDNMNVGLAPILQNLGLDATTGIGSVVAGALGNAAGIGGAGINQDQIAEFVRTHDYGVFTRAAINDNTARTPNQQDQIDAWKRSTGISDDTAARRALGYIRGSSSSGSSNYVPGNAFGGLPGQYGNAPLRSIFDPTINYLKAASGFEGVVSTPTHFLAGEAGPENVSIRPLSKPGSTGGGSITVIVQGSLLRENELSNIIRSVNKDDIRRVF